MFYEAIFQPSEKMNYNTDAKRLAGKKILYSKIYSWLDSSM
jgi:hypothetical protein